MDGQRNERHSGSLFFHIFFKACAVVWYIVCELFSSSFVTNFVISLVLIALDFWTVKNVTGRRLVGLRWWNEANDSGSAWRFESAPEGSRVIHPYEKRMFWIMLVAAPAAWIVLGFFSLIRLKWDYLIIPIIGTIMGSSNLVGYFKCSREAGEQLKSMTGSLVRGAVSNSINNAISRV